MVANVRYYRCVLLFFVVSFGYATEYVTTDNGSRLFFDSSSRLVGTNQSFNNTLFSWDAENGVQLVYEHPDGWVHSISVTGDGSFAAFQVSTGGYKSHGELLNLRTGKFEILAEAGASRAIISRNGRFLVTGDALIDRFYGASRPVSHGVDAVGDDGSLLYRQGNALHRIDPDGTDRIVTTEFRDVRFIDASGDTTLAIVSPFPYYSQFVVDTITGRQLVDLDAAGASYYSSALLSSDGQWLAFSADQPSGDDPLLLLCRPDATGCRTVGDPPVSGVAAIAGDGSALFAGLPEWAIGHVDVSSGRKERAFGVASFMVMTPAPFVRGSLVRIREYNAGNHITINGREAPLLSPPGAMPVVQIPWDLEEDQVRFTISGGGTPFEMLSRPYGISDFFPGEFAPGDPEVDGWRGAYCEDWSATTDKCPAEPGEIVHIYAVGLGEVACPVENGQPAPVDRPCPITRTVDWTWRTAPAITEPAEVLFVGLAPGMVGLYQIDVRAPHYNGYRFVDLLDGDRIFAAVRIRTGSRLDPGSCGFSRRCPTPDTVRRPATSRAR